MLLGLVAAVHLVERAGEVVVDVGVVGVIAKGPFKRGHRQIVLARLGQHAAEIRPGLDVILVQFDGHVISLSRPAEITEAVEQLGHLEADFRLRPARSHCGAIHVGGGRQLAVLFELGGQTAYVLWRLKRR